MSKEKQKPSQIHEYDMTPAHVIKKYFAAAGVTKRINGHPLILLLESLENPQVSAETKGKMKLNLEANADHLKALDIYATLLPSNPFTAIIEYSKDGHSHLIISPSQWICRNETKSDYSTLKIREEALREYCFSPSEKKLAFYKCLYDTHHSYIYDALVTYKHKLEKEDSKMTNEVNSMIGNYFTKNKKLEGVQKEIFEDFIDYWVKEKDLFPIDKISPLLMQYQYQDMQCLDPTGNVPHVEMTGITRALKNLGVDHGVDINLGLAYKGLLDFAPSTCGGCTAEINALRDIKEITVHSTASYPCSLPLGKKYRLSDNTLNGREREKVAEHIINSEFMASLQKRANYHLRDGKIEKKNEAVLKDFLKDLFEVHTAYHHLSPLSDTQETSIDVLGKSDIGTGESHMGEAMAPMM